MGLPTNDFHVAPEALDHHHQFTIPVQWEYKSAGQDWGHSYRDHHATDKRVTKLRCACGEETVR